MKYIIMKGMHGMGFEMHMKSFNIMRFSRKKYDKNAQRL